MSLHILFWDIGPSKSWLDWNSEEEWNLGKMAPKNTKMKGCNSIQLNYFFEIFSVANYQFSKLKIWNVWYGWNCSFWLRKFNYFLFLESILVWSLTRMMIFCHLINWSKLVTLNIPPPISPHCLSNCFHFQKTLLSNFLI